MKTAILVIFAAWLLVGCGVRYIGPGAADRDYSDASQDTMYEAQVREWLTTEQSRIKQKKADIFRMFDENKITYGESNILLDRVQEDERTIVERALKRFPH